MIAVPNQLRRLDRFALDGYRGSLIGGFLDSEIYIRTPEKRPGSHILDLTSLKQDRPRTQTRPRSECWFSSNLHAFTSFGAPDS